VAPGAHRPLLCRGESAGGHRKRPDAAGPKWTREGLQPHQQTAISTDGRTRGSERPRDNIGYASRAPTPSFTFLAVCPERFQLRQNLPTGVRGKLPGEGWRRFIPESKALDFKKTSESIFSHHLAAPLHPQCPILLQQGRGGAGCRHCSKAGGNHSSSRQQQALLLGLLLPNPAAVLLLGPRLCSGCPKHREGHALVTVP